MSSTSKEGTASCLSILHVCFCEATYIWVDFAVAHSEGTLFVQQDTTVSWALVHFLLSNLTVGDGGVGFLITPVNTDSKLEKVGMCYKRVCCILVWWPKIFYLTIKQGIFQRGSVLHISWEQLIQSTLLLEGVLLRTKGSAVFSLW